uniref:Neuroglian-like protein n=1 Tax=Parasacculina yatsui TaxID=2836420 RepID=A0A8K1RCI4_9CRUS|nr:neuroglian-like protein [Parasacculina yatsui]
MLKPGLFLIFLLTQSTSDAFTYDDEYDHMPPLIDEEHQPIAGEMTFEVVSRTDKNKRPFMLDCEASGSRIMQYYWKKNGKNFTWAVYDDRISKQPDRGTLIVSDPRDEDAGSYQCFAYNRFGTAASNTVFLRKTVLGDFQSSEIRTIYADRGDALVLKCDPPRGYPPPVVDWLFVESDRSLKNLASPRKTVGPFGNLYFSNVTDADDSGEGHYACTATSKFRGEFKLGNRVRLRVRQTSSVGSQNRKQPAKQFLSTNNVITLRGQQVELWCIFSGTPVPEITWSKSGDRTFLNGGHIRLRNHGKTLTIDVARLEDTGEYTCQASNGIGSPESHSFYLRVNAKPRFIKAPQLVNAAEGETATFECEADGVPSPEIRWIRNGRPLDQYPSNARMERSSNRIVIHDLLASDTANYGCNATNSVGYVYRDVYVNVRSVPPRIGRGPGANAAVIGSAVVLECQVSGAPKPLVTWRRGGRDGHELTGGRYQIQEGGNLRIDNVAFTDSGRYTCHAKNKISEDFSVGSLIVKERTRITHASENYQVVAGEAATFRCSAAGDPTLKVAISWLAQGVAIDFQLEPRFILTPDSSLTISKTTELDSKTYTCLASTELDQVTANATLIVEDRPNPPRLDRVDCSDREARVLWSAQGENRAPIISYTIQYNTSFTPDTWVDTENIDPQVDSYIITLSPWANHTFRVIARNRVGPSAPSGHSQVCTTRQEVPNSNPRNVEGRGSAPDNLVIYWTPMPMIEHNAPGLNYRVEWRLDPEEQENQEPSGRGAAQWNSQLITDWRRGQLTVPNQRSYQRYRLRVTALNRQGQSNVAARDVLGWSGEDVPTAAPQNLRFVSWEADGRALVAWDPVDAATLRGKFVGYKVQAWPKREGRAARREVVFGPMQNRGLLDILRPYAQNELHVMAFNGAYNGPPSNILPVFAKEGLPSAVDSLEAVPMGSSAFYLLWQPPAEANGVLTGYRVLYQQIDGLRVGPLLKRQPSVSNGTSRAKLAGLRPATKYRISVRAINGAGAGPPYYIERTTNVVSALPPSRPSFVWRQPSPGSGSVHITWIPDIAGIPGSHFFVQYRRYGEFNWMSTADEYYEDSIVVTGLDLGQMYDIRVVSVDGRYFMHSDIQQLRVYPGQGQMAAAVRPVATAGWLVALLLCVALLLLLLGAVCLISRSRGAKYHVHDRELLHGAMDPDQAEHEHDGFREYERPPDSKLTRPHVGVRDSDVDSTHDYADDPEDGMDEDGSFIGQYMGRRDVRQQHETSADKIGTFV